MAKTLIRRPRFISEVIRESAAQSNCTERSSRSTILLISTRLGNCPKNSSVPRAAIIKHTNPCGCAEQDSLAEAYRKALEADPISAFGGVLAFNRELDEETAAEVSKLFVEAIAAPGFSPEALRHSDREEESAPCPCEAFSKFRSL